MLLKALGETLPVYEGEIRATGRLGIKWSPPMPAKFMEPFGKTIDRGTVQNRRHVTLPGLQRRPSAKPPQAIKFELPLSLKPESRRRRKSRPSVRE